jgi:hypothetical protein
VAYNFGDQRAHGKLRIQGATAGSDAIEIAPGDRVQRSLKVNGPGKVTARLELDDAGQAVVSANVIEPQLKN